MISDQDAHDAIGQVIAALGVEMMFAGQEVAPERPYLSLQLIPTGSQDRTLAGSSRKLFGYVQVSVCVEGGNSAKVGSGAQRIGEQVVALFFGDPDAGRSKLAVSGGTVTVLRAEAKAGYPDGAGYRVPVQIYYRTNPN